jgi:hypothetical protein
VSPPSRAPPLPFPFRPCNPPSAESACPRARIPGSCIRVARRASPLGGLRTQCNAG